MSVLDNAYDSSTAGEVEKIRELLYAYCYYFDSGQADKWATLFTEDCVWEGEGLAPDGVGTARNVGPEAQAALCRMANSNGAKFRHLTINTVISVSGDTARANSYVLVIHNNVEGLKVNSCRYYDDHLVKQGGHWRFKARSYVKELSPDQIIV